MEVKAKAAARRSAASQMAVRQYLIHPQWKGPPLRSLFKAWCRGATFSNANENLTVQKKKERDVFLSSSTDDSELCGLRRIWAGSHHTVEIWIVVREISNLRP